VYTPDLLYMMRNISTFVNVRWFLGILSFTPRSPPNHSYHLVHAGIPFFNITPPQLAIAEAGQAILGDFLLGLQAGNEPDLYVAHSHRPAVRILFSHPITTQG